MGKKKDSNRLRKLLFSIEKKGIDAKRDAAFSVVSKKAIGEKSRGRPKKSRNPTTDLWILRTLSEKDEMHISRLREALREKARIFDRRGIQRWLKKLKNDGLVENPRVGYWRLPSNCQAFATIFKKFYYWYRLEWGFAPYASWRNARTQLVYYCERVPRKNRAFSSIIEELDESVETKLELESLKATHFRFLLLLAELFPQTTFKRISKAAKKELNLKKRSVRAHLQELGKEKVHLFDLPLEMKKDLKEKRYEMVKEEFRKQGIFLSKQPQFLKEYAFELLEGDREKSSMEWSELPEGGRENLLAKWSKLLKKKDGGARRNGSRRQYGKRKWPRRWNVLDKMQLCHPLETGKIIQKAMPQIQEGDERFSNRRLREILAETEPKRLLTSFAHRRFFIEEKDGRLGVFEQILVKSTSLRHPTEVFWNLSPGLQAYTVVDFEFDNAPRIVREKFYKTPYSVLVNELYDEREWEMHVRDVLDLSSDDLGFITDYR